jgi:uncharacterized protein DUF397
MDHSDATWRKSSISGVNGCVEVAFREGHVFVRDSKDRQGLVLTFDSDEWRAFTVAVHNDEFELPEDLTSARNGRHPPDVS